MWSARPLEPGFCGVNALHIQPSGLPLVGMEGVKNAVDMLTVGIAPNVNSAAENNG